MFITSREYKVIVDAALCAEVRSACRDIVSVLEDLALVHGCKVTGNFDEQPKERTIVFLDTSDYALRGSGLLLRQRIKRKKDVTEYTLKCRSEDRYIAGGQDVQPATKLKGEQKFEEDVRVPFVSRFSNSCTVSIEEGKAFAGDKLPRTLGDAGRLFPVLHSLRRDGMKCDAKTPLHVVNQLQAFERVFGGPELHLPDSTTATIVLILWQKGKKGRLLTAEFSFRYEAKKERFSSKVAGSARRFFEGVQRFDWARPEALTKTQYMYGGRPA